MATHVLVPFDESPQSAAALEYALETFDTATITVLHVNDPREWMAASDEFDTFYDASQDRIQESTQAVFDHAEEIAADHGRDVTTDAVTGKPSDQIVTYAEDHSVDHIVIGSHGRTGLERFLIGSVAERVVRRSPVPVTVMRKPNPAR